MSTLLNKASLVLVPSGYKEDIVYSQIPTNGDGDLTFTRASDATRVNSAGLVERVPYNLIQQSNTFNVTWSNINTTETSGQTGYDGTNNAWLLTDNTTNGVHALRQFPSITGLVTLSVYAKADTLNWMFLRGVQSGANVRAWFNLSTGTIGTVETNGTAKMQSVGNGWYRCSLTVANFQSGFEVYIATASGDNTEGYVGSGQSILIQNAQLVEGSTAKPYFPTTDRLNVPRLDYSGGSCPSLLLEPQRTNLALYSEQFDNASWAKTRCTITANFGTSPDGTQNADKFVEDTTNNSKFLVKSVTTVDSSSYTLSLFAKAAERNEVALVSRDKSGAFKTTIFGLTSGTIVSDQHTGTKIEDYGNGWYRCSVVFNSGTGATATNMYVQTALNGNLSYQGDGTSGILIYGAGWELGSYPTSYIPTTSSAATRVADFSSNNDVLGTSYSSNDFAYFIEFDLLQDSGTSNSPMLFGGGGSGLGASGQCYLRMGLLGNNTLSLYGHGDVLMASVIYAFTKDTNYKVLVKRSGTSIKFYVNGAQVGSTGTSSLDFTLRSIGWSYNAGTYNTNGHIKQFLGFQTALTDSECASLTGNQNYTINQAYASYGVASESPNCVQP